MAGREESETFAVVTEISDQLDPFCINALDIYACYFIYPPCDPDRGTYSSTLNGCTLMFMLCADLYLLLFSYYACFKNPIAEGIKLLTFISIGSQLTLCKESCNIVDMVNDRCQSQFTSMKRNRSAVFWDYVYNFNCSSPESYLIPDLPPDTEKCLQADDVCELFLYICV